MKLYFSLKSINPDKMRKSKSYNLVYCIKKKNQFYNLLSMHNWEKGVLNESGGWRKIEIKKVGYEITI